MEDQFGPIGTVDPEVRAYVTSLVTALGGSGGYDDGRYVLGDDAIACLKDIRRWLKLYDEKLDRLDVARVLAERNLVKGDLLEILASWPEDAAENKFQAKVVLSCLELLVPLTWPIEKTELEPTVNHLRNAPYLGLAQIGYKREILDHASGSILKTALRVGLPSLALPIGERTQRDEGIIKLLLYFYRNIAIITAPPNLPVEWNENEVSRSATIEAFAQQDVLNLVLTIASNLGGDFNTQDVVVLELLFHLVKGIDVEDIFFEDEEMEARHSKDLRNLMTKEADMLRGFKKEAPTRHNRFGTMIWVKRDAGKMSSVSGQDALGDRQRVLNKMDQSKKWNKPRHGRKEEQTQNHFDAQVHLTRSAAKHLRTFVEEFLDSGFNPLMQNLRRAIEREAERVLMAHSHQFFYLINWFLGAERARRRVNKASLARKHNDATFEPESFSLIASVLNQETFVLLNRHMQDRLDTKVWHEVNASMRAFTQILLTVQEMAASPLEEDQEIAENIQNRIFYEETTHDRVLLILRTYKDQGFNYLDSCTELSHVFLRMLETYSKENGDLQIRSRRKARQKRKENQQGGEGEADGDQDSEAEDLAETQRMSRERKFDFKRFASRFVNQHCVDTFVKLTTYYKDLTNEQLKRAHRFFYRLAFKQDMSVTLFRVDIISLFHRMIKGPEPLSQTSPMYREWEEFIRQIFRRLTKKLQARPELAVEMLFSKISSTTFYLEYGNEKQTMSAKPRPPAELELRVSMSWEEQIGVVVAALYEEHLDAIIWVENELKTTADTRQSWAAELEARAIEAEVEEGVPIAATPSPHSLRPDNDERRIQMFKNGRLRLLMTLAGFERLGEDEPYAQWVIPSSITAEKLRETSEIIQKHRMDPVTSYGDEGLSAEDMLRRKSQAPAARVRAEFDDDSDGLGDFLEDEFLFPVGHKLKTKPAALDELKRRRKRRRSSNEEVEPLDEETLRERRRQRELNEIEKRRKIKSTEFIYDSDEEDPERDAEFFALEEQRRQEQASKVADAMDTAEIEGQRSRKRKTIDDYDDDIIAEPEKRSRNNKDEDEEMTDASDDETEARHVAQSSSSPKTAGDDNSNDEDETPLSSQSEQNNEQVKALGTLQVDDVVNRPSTLLKGSDDALGVVEDQVEPTLPAARRRARTIAVLDDSDDE